MNKKVIIRKIIIIGSYAVGKTSIVNRYTINKFSDEYKATLGVKVSRKMVELDNVIVKLLIWDIADMLDCANVPEAYVNGAHGIIFVYDLSRKNTRESLELTINSFHEKLPYAKYIVAGNKTDLFTDESYYQKLVVGYHIAHYYTSAKSGKNVDSAFKHIAKLVSEHKSLRITG